MIIIFKVLVKVQIYVKKNTCVDKVCYEYTNESSYRDVIVSQWINNSCSTKTGSTDKACSIYTTEVICKDVETCQQHNNTSSTNSESTKLLMMIMVFLV